MYVDTTAPNLNLSDRPVSKSLLQVAGQKLQDECTRYVQQHGNVPAWSFATTGPGNLKCKHIFHTVASDYDGPGGSAEKVRIFNLALQGEFGQLEGEFSVFPMHVHRQMCTCMQTHA